jgi:hypothetical protein
MAADDLIVNSATNSKVTWTPANPPGSAAVTLPNANWSIDTTGNVVLMVNGRDGVKRKRTYKDASAQVTAFKDEVSLLPGTNVAEGDVGTLRCYFADTRFRQMTAILESIGDGSGNPGDPHNLALNFSLESGLVTNGTD